MCFLCFLQCTFLLYVTGLLPVGVIKDDDDDDERNAILNDDIMMT